MRVNADLFQSLRYLVARTHDVANLQVGCDLHINTARTIRGGMVVVVRPHTGIAYLLNSLAEFEIAAARDGLDGIAVVSAQRRWAHGKCNRRGIICRQME